MNIFVVALNFSHGFNLFTHILECMDNLELLHSVCTQTSVYG